MPPPKSTSIPQPIASTSNPVSRGSRDISYRPKPIPGSTRQMAAREAIPQKPSNQSRTTAKLTPPCRPRSLNGRFKSWLGEKLPPQRTGSAGLANALRTPYKIKVYAIAVCGIAIIITGSLYGAGLGYRHDAWKAKRAAAAEMEKEGKIVPLDQADEHEKDERERALRIWSLEGRKAKLTPVRDALRKKIAELDAKIAGEATSEIQ